MIPKAFSGTGTPGKFNNAAKRRLLGEAANQVPPSRPFSMSRPITSKYI